MLASLLVIKEYLIMFQERIPFSIQFFSGEYQVKKFTCFGESELLAVELPKRLDLSCASRGLIRCGLFSKHLVHFTVEPDCTNSEYCTVSYSECDYTGKCAAIQEYTFWLGFKRGKLTAFELIGRSDNTLDWPRLVLEHYHQSIDRSQEENLQDY